MCEILLFIQMANHQFLNDFHKKNKLFDLLMTGANERCLIKKLYTSVDGFMTLTFQGNINVDWLIKYKENCSQHFELVYLDWQIIEVSNVFHQLPSVPCESRATIQVVLHSQIQ